MGGGIHHSTSSVNVYFDAEAAKIGFRAGWPKLTLVTTDLAEEVHMADDGKVDYIVDHAHSPIADLLPVELPWAGTTKSPLMLFETPYRQLLPFSPFDPNLENAGRNDGRPRYRSVGFWRLR